MMQDEMNFAMEYKPSIWERFWRGMGYRHHLNELPDDPELPGWLMNEAYIHFGWLDRFRLLLTGRLYLTTRMATNVSVEHASSALSFRIGYPGERRP